MGPTETLHITAIRPGGKFEELDAWCAMQGTASGLTMHTGRDCCDGFRQPLPDSHSQERMFDATFPKLESDRDSLSFAAPHLFPFSELETMCSLIPNLRERGIIHHNAFRTRYGDYNYCNNDAYRWADRVSKFVTVLLRHHNWSDHKATRHGFRGTVRTGPDGDRKRSFFSCDVSYPVGTNGVLRRTRQSAHGIADR